MSTKFNLRTNNIPVYLSPVYIFLFLSVFFFLIPIILNVDNLTTKAMLVFFTGTIFFVLGYKTSLLKVPYVKADNKLCANLAIAALFSDITFVVYNYIQPYNIQNNESYADIYKNIGFLDIFPAFLWSSVKVFLYGFLFTRKKLFVVVLIVSLLNSFYSDVRIHFLTTVFLGGLFLHYHNIVKITIPRIIIVISIMPVFFVILLLKRGYRYRSDNESSTTIVIKLFESLGDIANLDLLLVALESPNSYKSFLLIISDKFDYYFSTFFRLFWNFIPRSIYEDKPEALSRVLAKLRFPESYEQGGGFVATIFGEGWLAFGWLGVLLTLFLFGVVSSHIKKTLWRSKRKVQNVYYIAVYPYIIFTIFVQSFRGFFWERLWQVILLLFLIALIAKISNIKFR